MLFSTSLKSLALRPPSFGDSLYSTFFTMVTAQSSNQAKAIAKPMMYLLFSILTFYLAVTCYLRSTTSKLMLHTILITFAWLSFTNMNDLVPPLDVMWGLMMAVWISHSASLLWIEQNLLESIIHNECCALSMFCCCPSHQNLRSLWYDWSSIRELS